MDNIETAALFIRTLMHLNVSFFQREGLPSSLPLTFSANQLSSDPKRVHSFLSSIEPNTICMLSDKLKASYCLLGFEDQIAVIGPYRSGTVKKYEAEALLQSCGIPSDYIDDYLHHINSLLEYGLEKIRIVARTLMMAILGDNDKTVEQTIDMRQAHPSLSAADYYEHDLDSASFIESTHSMESYYMLQISQGRFEEAALAAHNLFRRTSAKGAFEQSRAIEGMAILRTSTRIASRQAGVPSSAINAITEHYKRLARKVSSSEEMEKLNLQMANEACALVIQYRAKSYGHTIRRAIDYIHRNLDKHISVSELAAQVGLSPNRLSHQFHKEVGTTLTKYISDKRMEEAANLLTYTNFNMQTISDKVGISNSNYFSKLFREKYGKSPREFRRSSSL